MTELNSAGPERKVLVIEDNPADVVLLKVALRRAGIECELSVIADGGAALEMVRAQEVTAPDLVIMDLNLPKVGGGEILAAMRSSVHFGDVPVVILTSSNSIREREQLAAYKIVRHLTKPADLTEFFTVGTVIKDILDRL
jgi:CheY-like chemotaxis protein